MKKAASGVCRLQPLVFLSGSILPNWRYIFGQLFLGSLAFGLLGLAGFHGVRGLDKNFGMGTNGRAGSSNLP
jgi:hypothetical protein